MNPAFRRLPLPVKLLLIGLVPLAFLAYLSYEFYAEKTENIGLLANFINRIRNSEKVNSLTDHLQKERKLSFDFTVAGQRSVDLDLERQTVDSIVSDLQQGADAVFESFPQYTFLKDIAIWRSRIDSGTSADLLMHYYSTMIFRLNSLNTVSYGSEIYLKPIFKDLIAQKLLSELTTNLNLVRSNIYNVLVTRKYMIETLMGLAGVFEVLKTYETEFLIKASPSTVTEYQRIRNTTALKPTMEYLDMLFARFSFDEKYDATQWWKISDTGADQLRTLQKAIWNRVNEGSAKILATEKRKRTTAVILLAIALLLVGLLVFLSIESINRKLRMIRQAAQKLSEGGSDPALPPTANDVIGGLVTSIKTINNTNKQLARAAIAIGKGDFETNITPRSKDDTLGNAIKQMKDNLVEFRKLNEDSNRKLELMAEKYKTIFYKSPLPKWIYDFETFRFLEVNDAAVRQYGYSREEFLNLTILDIRPDDDHKKLLDDVAQISENAPGISRHWRHKKKNGEIFIAEVMAHFIEFNDRRARLVIAHDITEKINAEENLKHSHEELRSLASRLQEIREEERASMAREVHDVLGQQITCLKMDISWIAKKLAVADPALKEKLQETTQLLDQTALIVRKIASELRPSILDDFGLIEALEWHSREFEKRSGIRIEFQSTVAAVSLPQNITIALFRIYQESLTNVARHASATEARVQFSQENDLLILTITDNGLGFDVSQSDKKKTLGLLGMRERTLMIGGQYEISSIPGKGTTVTATVPIHSLQTRKMSDVTRDA